MRQRSAFSASVVLPRGLLLAVALVVLPSVAGPPHPLPPAGEMEQCHRLIETKQYEQARERLTRIVAGHPTWQRAVFFLGLTFHEEQRYAAAQPLFARALDLDPLSADVPLIRLHYAWASYYLGQTETARLQLLALLAVRPQTADAHFALGLLEIDADRVESATSHLKTAIELAASAEDARMEGKARARLADVLVRNGDLAGARAELEAALRLRPDAYEAYYKLSRVLERLGDPDGAARALEMHQKVREQVRPSVAPAGVPR